MSKPSTLMEAFYIAQTCETRLEENPTELGPRSRSLIRSPSSAPPSPIGKTTPSLPPYCLAPLQTVSPQNKPSHPGLLSAPNLIVRCLTPAELQDKREHGLCYNCDQKWSHGHQCPNKFLLLLGIYDEEVVAEEFPTAAAAY